MSMILAIDPGTHQSAWVSYEAGTSFPGKIWSANLEPNHLVLSALTAIPQGTFVLIERMTSYGKRVGEEVFETLFWSGRFAQVVDTRGMRWGRLNRKKILAEICGTATANDTKVRHALARIWGGSIQSVKGTSKNPGPLFSISADMWQALAVAVAYHKLRKWDSE